MGIDVRADIKSILDALMDNPHVQKALAFLKQDEASSFEELQKLACIPAPTFSEQDYRSPAYLELLRLYGAEDCEMDEMGNVWGYVNGSAPRPVVMIDAHIDTVFSYDVPLTIKQLAQDRYNCPGMADDTACLAMDLSVLRALRYAGLRPVGRIRINGAVRHEGEGDLQGMKAIVERERELDVCLCAETLSRPGAIINTVLGVYRYELIFRGQGGHSWLDFGRPNPIQAACRFGAALSALIPSDNPKTTFNIGTISGGTTVNSIPMECHLKLDLRSVSAEGLDELDEVAHRLAEEAVKEENARWSGGERISVEFIRIGNRPAGHTPDDASVLQVFWSASELVGLKPFFWPPLGTNGNVPLHAGIPTLSYGGGGIGGNLHSREEWYSPNYSVQHAQRLLLSVLAMAGLEGVSQPLAQIIQR